MSEPTVPTPSASEGWPPRVPTNPEPLNYPSTEAGSTYPTPAPSYHQFYVEKPAEIIEGEKLAKTSTILGIVSLTTGLGAFIGPFAIVKAAKAERLGVDSTIGKVTGWLGTIFGAIAILVTILYIALFGALLAAGDGFDSKDIKTGGFSNSQNYKQSQTDESKSDTPKSNFDKIYEKLTPAEKAEMDKQLDQLDAVVSNR
jgi:hypothetical protein